MKKNRTTSNFCIRFDGVFYARFTFVFAYLPLFFVLHSLCFGTPSPDVDTQGEFQGRLKANLMLSGERAVPNTEVEPWSFSDIARSIIMREYPFAGGILGDGTAMSFEDSELVVAVSITNVSTEALFFVHEPTSLGGDRIYWHKVTCEVLAVIKGETSPKVIEFLACRDRHRVHWPYVRGFCYILGLKNVNGEWEIVSQQRTCPLSPYKPSDHCSFPDGIRGTIAEADVEWAKDTVARWIRKKGEQCLDVSMEKNEYLVLTFASKSFHGIPDYSEGVSIVVFSLSGRNAVFPLSLFSRYETMDVEPSPMSVDDFEAIVFGSDPGTPEK